MHASMQAHACGLARIRTCACAWSLAVCIHVWLDACVCVGCQTFDFCIRSSWRCQFCSWRTTVPTSTASNQFLFPSLFYHNIRLKSDYAVVPRHVMCSHDEWLLQVAFSASRQAQIPPIYGMHFDTPDQLCIEELVVPVGATMYVRNSAEVNLLRDSAQRLCALPQLASRVELESPHRASQLSVIFFERAVDRLLLNAAELCRRLSSNGIPDSNGHKISVDAWQATEHLDACADLHELWPADVVVSVHGTHEVLMCFLQPGTAVVKIYPRKMCVFFPCLSPFRCPLNILLNNRYLPMYNPSLFYARIRTIEIFATGLQPPSDQCPSNCTELPGSVLANPTELCCTGCKEGQACAACNISCLSQCNAEWIPQRPGSGYGIEWWSLCRKCSWTVHHALIESSVQAAALLVGRTDEADFAPCEPPSKLGNEDLLGRERYPELNWHPCSPDALLKEDRMLKRRRQHLEAQSFTLAVPGPDGDPMNLDIPDIHNQASVSIHVTEFCNYFNEMLAYFTQTIATGTCFEEMIKEVEERREQHLELLPKPARLDIPDNQSALQYIDVCRPPPISEEGEPLLKGLYANSGIAYAKRGLTHEALEMWRRVLALAHGPGHPLVGRVRECVAEWNETTIELDLNCRFSED